MQGRDKDIKTALQRGNLKRVYLKDEMTKKKEKTDDYARKKFLNREND